MDELAFLARVRTNMPNEGRLNVRALLVFLTLSHETKPIRFRFVAEKANVSRPTLARAVATLHGLGLVSSLHGKVDGVGDARDNWLSVTPLGADVAARIIAPSRTRLAA